MHKDSKLGGCFATNARKGYNKKENILKLNQIKEAHNIQAREDDVFFMQLLQWKLINFNRIL